MYLAAANPLIHMRQLLLFCFLLVPLLCTAQQNPFANRDTVSIDEATTRRGQSVEEFRRINEIYNQLYLYNAEIGYVCPPYTDLFGPRTYTLTADIVPHFFLLAGNHYRGALSFSPRVKLRIMNQESYPIRTPSFMPSVTYHLRISDNTRRYTYLTANVTHHSNGQDGPEALPNGMPNLVNGNFATNFVELAYNFGYTFTKAFQVPNNRSWGLFVRRDTTNRNIISYFKIGLQQHFGSDDFLPGRYGFTRLNFRMNRIRLGQHVIRLRTRDGRRARTLESYITEKGRFVLSGQWIFSRQVDYQPLSVFRQLNLELAYYYRLRSQYANSYLYAAVGYYGQDPYNIYFQDHYAFVRFGLAAGINVYKSQSVASFSEPGTPARKTIIERN